MVRFEVRPVAAVSVVAVLLLVLLGAGAPARGAPGLAGPQPHAGSVAYLNVSVTDALKFVLSTDEVPLNATVHVVVTQVGSVLHTFTLASVAGFSFPASDGTSELDAYFAQHPPLVNLTVPATTGAVVYANFTSPAFGIYEFVCLEPGHFQAGMFGFLGAGEHGGGQGTADTGPGAPVFIITAVIVVLVIIALVLGFVIGKRRGAKEEMPPERLGYPEPTPARPPAAP